eukprot:gene4299-5021_t
MRYYELYRRSTVGEALTDTLDELVQNQLISQQLYEKVLAQFDKSINEALANTVKTKATFKSRKSSLYRSLLGENVSNELKSSFWDVIVITAIDDEQKVYYEQMIKQKVANGTIPSFVQYFVIADPPGHKIGCGGSTLYTLSRLDDLLTSESMSKYKILLLHAGGYSKRLPNHSTTGKIFASLPFSLVAGGTACTMLEMKIIILVDFPVKMRPGVFLACSDDIELFESEGMEMTAPGFTALAHPGTIDVGLGHGIFVLENNAQYKPNVPNKCTRYLHKPTKAKMQQEHAILGESNQVLLDSCYFFDDATTKLLLTYYNANNPITCEIDAYADFLQPLGSDAKPDYFENTNNVALYTPALKVERQFNSCVVDKHQQTSFIHCLANGGNITIGANSVVEFCHFDNTQVTIGDRCIVSDLQMIGGSITLPSNTFIQTLSVKENSYVTIMFGIDDNLKSTGNSTLFGSPLATLLQTLGLDESNVWSAKQDKSLWNASIFPICHSPSASVHASLDLLINAKPSTSTTGYYSMDECLANKDLTTQSSRRTTLTNLLSTIQPTN